MTLVSPEMVLMVLDLVRVVFQLVRLSVSCSDNRILVKFFSDDNHKVYLILDNIIYSILRELNPLSNLNYLEI